MLLLIIIVSLMVGTAIGFYIGLILLEKNKTFMKRTLVFVSVALVALFIEYCYGHDIFHPGQDMGRCILGAMAAGVFVTMIFIA